MVMQSYTERWGRGAAWDELPMIPAPAGTSLGQTDVASILAEVATALSLNPVGIYTPWATRTGDLTWEEIKNPDTNIALYQITDDQVNAVPQITFGSPLPFVGIVTKNPLTETQVAAMWDGTAYEPYQTQAIYRLDDAKDVPTLYFLHWGSRIDSDSPLQRSLAIGPKAASANGSMVFAAQVPFTPSTARSGPPPLSFNDALTSQMAAASAPAQAQIPVTAPAAPAAPVATAAPTARSNVPVALAVGAGLGVAVFLFWRRKR